MLSKIMYVSMLMSIMILSSCSKDEFTESEQNGQIQNNPIDNEIELSTTLDYEPHPLQKLDFDVPSTEKIVDVNGEKFAVIDHGTGPVVLLIHGFPDSKEVWRYQVPALANAGFRVIAPDMRGYGGSPRSPEKERYALGALIGDVLGILAALEISEPVDLAGHDWGAVLAWSLARFVPGRFKSLTVLSNGAPGNPGYFTLQQQEKSWFYYMVLQEELAEKTFTENDWAFFRDFAKSHPDLENTISRLSEATALTTAFNWYRGNLQHLLTPCEGPLLDQPGPSPNVSIPVLGIWGQQDAFLRRAQIVQSRDVVDNTFSFVKIQDAGHWLMLEKPSLINSMMIDFIKCTQQEDCK